MIYDAAFNVKVLRDVHQFILLSFFVKSYVANVQLCLYFSSHLRTLHRWPLLTIQVFKFTMQSNKTCSM